MRPVARVAAGLLAAMGVVSMPGASGPASASPSQRIAAARLVAETRADMARFASVNAALADGYRRLPGQVGIVHFENDAYLSKGLDPQHPQSLVYLDTPSGMRLVAAMFLMGTPGEHGPQVGGSLTPWHTHATCYGSAGPALPDRHGRCPVGDHAELTPEMLHVWAASVGGNPFASAMSPYALQCQLDQGRQPSSA